MKIECVEFDSIADRAISLIDQFWKPPRLAYDEAYLRWELSFPSERKPFVVVATEDDDLVGFLAAMPRRVKFRALATDAYLTSFLAVSAQAPPATGLVLARTIGELMQG